MIQYENKYKKFLDNNPYPRQLKSLDPHQGSYFYVDGKKIINFSSSDYLGLSQHPMLIQRSQEYTHRFGVGSGASRLITGNLFLYDELEHKLAKALQKPAALIIGAGYQTNISVLEALLDAKILGQEPLVFCDKLAHASMIATTRHLTGFQRYRHNDLQHLQLLLEKFYASTQPKFILAESIYSMEGDAVDLAALIRLANQHQAALYIDDAHAVGVYGTQGWGKATDYADDIPFMMGTFSKALGSYGAYIGCTEVTRKYLINKCKGLIYSTALSPGILGAISAAIDVLPELTDKREQILKRAACLRHFFQQNSLDFGQSSTHIVPWIIGDAHKTRSAAALLEEYGIMGTAIQPPTVPVGKARIRFCMSAMHTEADFESLMYAIQKVASRL